MNSIHVQLRNATPRDELYPWYNEDADILEVRSRVSKSWPFGIDIDGNLIFDIDAERHLANLDLLIPKRLWSVQSGKKVRPTPNRRGALFFTEETLEHKSFHIPLVVMTDKSRSYASVRFGVDTMDPEVLCIALSQSCFAFVSGDRLEGFFFSLG